MRFRTLLSVILLALVGIVPARAAEWSIGSNLGATFQQATDDEAVDVSHVSWSGDVYGFVPGLRIGARGEGSPHEFVLDTGFSLVHSDRFSQSALQATLGYQYGWDVKSTLGPYVVGNVGVVTRFVDDIGPGNTSVTPMSPVFGFGVGFRRRVAQNHGTVRLEARFDYVTEGADQEVVLVPEAMVYGVRLGFDLWLQ